MTHTRTREVEDTLTGTPGGIAKEVDRRHQAGELVWVAPAKQLPSGLWQSRLKVRVPVQAGRDVQVRPARLPVRVQAVPVVAVRPWWRRRWPYVTAGVSTTLAGLWWAVDHHLRVPRRVRHDHPRLPRLPDRALRARGRQDRVPRAALLRLLLQPLTRRYDMAETCGTCPGLHAEIRALRAEVNMLQRQVRFLRDLVSYLVNGVRTTVWFIAAEIDEPSLARKRLLPIVTERLVQLLDDAARSHP
jgi:hypothetical protein